MDHTDPSDSSSLPSDNGSGDGTTPGFSWDSIMSGGSGHHPSSDHGSHHQAHSSSDGIFRPDPPSPGMPEYFSTNGADPMDRPRNFNSEFAVGCSTFYVVGTLAAFIGFFAFVISKMRESQQGMGTVNLGGRTLPSGFPKEVLENLPGMEPRGPQWIDNSSPFSQLASFICPALTIGLVVSVIILAVRSAKHNAQLNDE